MYTNNCTIIRYNDIQRVANLLHVSASFGHIHGGIQQISIQRISPWRWPKKVATCTSFTICFMLLYIIIMQLLEYIWRLVLLHWTLIILNFYISSCVGRTRDLELLQNKVTTLYITSFVVTLLVVLANNQLDALV